MRRNILGIAAIVAFFGSAAGLGSLMAVSAATTSISAGAATVLEEAPGTSEKETVLADVSLQTTGGTSSLLEWGASRQMSGLSGNQVSENSVEVEEEGKKIIEKILEGEKVAGYTNLGIAHVDNHLNIREEAKEDGKIIGKLPKNAGCEILDTTEDGWAHIQSGKVKGYVSLEFLYTGDEAKEIAQDIMVAMATVNTTTLKVREAPSLNSIVLTLIPEGEELEVLDDTGEWVKIAIDDEEGFISKEYVDISFQLEKAVTLTELQYGQGVSDVRVSLVQYAKQFVGNPYVWGGTSLTNGADCSGFVLSIYKKYGVSLPHSSVAQAGYGTKVSLAEAKPGDLIFYGNSKSINHVAIYIGSGQVVHASSKRTGIKISNATYRSPVTIRRILPD